MLTLKDFPVGKVLPLGPRTVTVDEIIEFAREFDPQPFHLDANSEQAKAVGGLIASGWHTSSLLMAMMCESYLLDTASEGSGGLDEVRWHIPVRPDDVLSGTATVLSSRVSKSKPDIGLVNFDYVLNNQAGEKVLTVQGMGMVKVDTEEVSR